MAAAPRLFALHAGVAISMWCASSWRRVQARTSATTVVPHPSKWQRLAVVWRKRVSCWKPALNKELADPVSHLSTVPQQMSMWTWCAYCWRQERIMASLTTTALQPFTVSSLAQGGAIHRHGTVVARCWC
eukprot:s5749_g3.t1